jgi:hypothetical protein
VIALVQRLNDVQTRRTQGGHDLSVTDTFAPDHVQSTTLKMVAV